jgi:hypothetical protein
MSDLEITKGAYTPEVELRDGFVSIDGNSYPANTEKFYKPILDWLREYVKRLPKYTEVHIKYEHMDSPTVKTVFEIIKTLKPIDNEQLSSVDVFWYYDLNDEEILDKGKLISDHLKMNFTFIPY